MQNGFENKQDRGIREDLPGGQKGVYFSDKDAQLELSAGIIKAKKLNDSQIAIIHVKSKKASPDRIGRYYWMSLAEDIEIMGIEYKNISDIDPDGIY